MKRSKNKWQIQVKLQICVIGTFPTNYLLNVDLLRDNMKFRECYRLKATAAQHQFSFGRKFLIDPPHSTETSVMFLVIRPTVSLDSTQKPRNSSNDSVYRIKLSAYSKRYESNYSKYAGLRMGNRGTTLPTHVTLVEGNSSMSMVRARR